jgi:Leucine-rich repeat (LRR) protein
MEDATGRAQQRALLSDESSAGSDESSGEARYVKPPSTAPQDQQTPADIARDEHDFFNLIALVSTVIHIDSGGIFQILA